MTESIESLASRESFLEFSKLGAINSVPDVEVIIDRSVDVVDGDGNVRHVAALVHVIKSEFPDWDPGDLLEAESGNVKLRQVITDDGYIQRIEATPVG
jgi:hypothetical protein